MVLAHKRDHSLTKPCFELNNCTPGEGTTLPILAQRPKKKRGEKKKKKLIKAFKEATIHVDFKDRIASPASTIYTEFCFLKAGCSNLILQECSTRELFELNVCYVRRMLNVLSLVSLVHLEKPVSIKPLADELGFKKGTKILL